MLRKRTWAARDGRKLCDLALTPSGALDGVRVHTWQQCRQGLRDLLRADGEDTWSWIL